MTTLGWVVLWVVLVLGALAVFGLLGWRLFRKATRLFHQASDSAELLADFAQAVEDAEHVPYEPVHAFAGGVEQKEQWRMVRRINRVKRAQRKARRREVTFARWRELTNPPGNV